MKNAALHKHRRVKVDKDTRDQVFRTYGERCHLCGYWVPHGQRTADHVKSNRGGGSTLLANLRPAHQFCNQLRGARPLTADVRAEVKAAYEQKVLAIALHRVGA